ncbi:uncharacterized protein [Onthophagus taurus]|uniref:uncharacterized protein n=1 Tax=Onthophagus taurus TaxID=166361 RepID=UPI0039BDD39E
MDVINTLTAEFHKIQTTNLQQSHKNFKLFLSTLPEKLKTNENEFISNLVPQTKLEHLFKIDILLHLKRHNDVLDVLKSGNNRYVGRILKDFDFFADLVPKLSVKMVMDDIFPEISYITKLKILNRISKTVKNEEHLDEYFEEIECKYGIEMAFVLLPGCSKKLIRFKVEKYVWKLPSRHVVEIYKKDHTFPLFYFDLLKKIDENFKFNDYSMLIKFIIKKDPTLFWNLQQKYKFDFKIGKHLTKTTISSNENVLKEGEKCLKWFQNKELYKIVKENDEFLLTLYGNTPIEFLEEQISKQNSSLLNILKYYSPESRYDLIKNLFSKKYSQNILRYETKFPFHFLEMIPISIREVIIKEHYHTNDDYLYLLHPNEAFVRIKKLLETCFKMEERKKQLRLLAKLVAINLKDEEIVTKIIKHVFERYRNDVQPFKVFVFDLCDEVKNLKCFNEDQLILLNQMAPYTITEYSNRLCAERISLAYLMYLIKNNKSYDDHLMDYLKQLVSDSYYNCISMRELEDMVLVIDKILEMVGSFKENKAIYNQLTREIIKRIFCYNKKHRRNLIPLSSYKEILQHVLSLENSYNNNEYFKYLIKRCNDKDIHQSFWKHYKTQSLWSLLIWFFKNDIKQIEDNLTLILSTIEYCPSINVYKAFGDYSNDFIKQKSLEYITNNINYDNAQKAQFLMPILCYIANTKTFLETTSNFMPPINGKFETENALNKKFLHGVVIKCLCNIELEKTQKLEIIKKVCIGDYLKFGLKLLYKTVLNMKEIDVLNFLNDFKLNQPISVSKHALFLALSLQLHESEQFLNEALKSEKNSSIKNIIFKKFFDIFFNTKNKKNYDQLSNYFKVINTEDKNLLEIMIKKIKFVPNEYNIDYIWNVFEMIKSMKKKERIALFITLSKNLPKNVLNDLPLNVLKSLIEIIVEDLFAKELREDCFWDLIINTNQENSKELFSFAMEIMKEKLSSFTAEIGYLQIRKSLNYFTTSFCKKILKSKDINHLNLIKILDMQWDFFPKHCLLNTNIFIKITKHFFESNFDFNKFAFLINNFLHQSIKEYDSSIISEFSVQINELFKIIDEKNNDLITFTNLLIQLNDHNYNYILAIYLLPKLYPTEDNKHYKWVEILRLIEEFCLKGGNTSCVWFHFDKYLRQSRSEFIWVGNQKFPEVVTTKL